MKMTNKFLVSLFLVMLLVVSVLFAAGRFSDPKLYAGTTGSIEQKITTVMELTAASTVSSAVISAIPGDTATPIADKMADFSTYFLAVLSILYLEKFLLSITGYAAFLVLVPIALVLFLIGLYRRPDIFVRNGFKFLALAATVLLLIPVSMKASDIVYSNYESSIQKTIDAAKNAADESDVYSEGTDSQEKDSIVSWVTSGTKKLMDSAANIMNRFIKALAVMIVTACLIPVLVLVFAIWLIKVIFAIDKPLQLASVLESRFKKHPVA